MARPSPTRAPSITDDPAGYAAASGSPQHPEYRRICGRAYCPGTTVRASIWGIPINKGPDVMRFIHGLTLGGLAIVLVIPSHSVAQSRYFTFERNMDPGYDYKGAPSPGSSDCSFACQVENSCRAWTYVKPGIQGRSGRCWLKSAVPKAVENDCCTSGKRTGRPGIID